VDRFGAEQQCAELWEQVHGLGRSGAAHGALAPAGRMHVLTRRAVNSVADDPAIGLEVLASKLRSSASEVSRYFHRDMGMTFARYRRRQRLLRFIALAEHGQGSLLASALEAGFGSYSQCHRTFQADLGCSPREFFAVGGKDEMQRLYDD
jgi:AraC-like DNA-binding protein